MSNPDWQLDPYVDSETGVLNNLPGFTRQADLDRYERMAAATAWPDAFEKLRTRDKFGLDELETAHRTLFGDVYDFAGIPRITDLRRGGPEFTNPVFIYMEAGRVFGQLAERDHLRGLSREAFVDGFTELYNDLNEIHPFREGNGRSQRVLMSAIAHRAGHEVSWDRALADKESFHEAAWLARTGDREPLRAVIDRVVARPAGASERKRGDGAPER